MMKPGGLEGLQRTSMSAMSEDSGIATAAAKKGERRIAITAAEGVFILVDVVRSLGDKGSVQSFASESRSC